MTNDDGGPSPETRGDAAPEAPARTIQMHVAEKDMTTTYANGFRTNATPEEVVFDFGLNLMASVAKDADPQMNFQVNQRVIMNYYTAKRLALALTRLIHRHEEQFGEIELDAAKRRRSGSA
jgi:hypothetical protein